MARFGKSNDPLQERERELRRQLEQLEVDLRRLASPERPSPPSAPKGSTRPPQGPGPTSGGVPSGSS